MKAYANFGDLIVYELYRRFSRGSKNSRGPKNKSQHINIALKKKTRAIARRELRGQVQNIDKGIE